MTKCVWTLNVNHWAPELCLTTYPYMLHFARKIDADFVIIHERTHPADQCEALEKLQIYELGRPYDWNLYIDSDCVVFPDMFDPTEHVKKDTVIQYSLDHAGNRFRYDGYLRRDGRDIGCCGLFSVVSDWCLDFFHPLDDLSYEDAVKQIFPIVKERMAGVTPEHLIDDYITSRNVARFGLKITTIEQIQKQNHDPGIYLWHTHLLAKKQKLQHLQAGLAQFAAATKIPEAAETKSWGLHDWIGTYGVV